MADFRINVIVDPRRAQAGSRRVRRELGGIENRARRVGRVLATAFAFAGITVGIGALVSLGDEFTNIQNRIRVVTSTTDELAFATEQLFEISQRTRSSFAATTEVYSRTALAARDLGISQQETLAFTESLNQAVILSGATAQEAQAGLIQLSQGLASGALRGDELRSVLEQLPVVADVIAKSLDITRGELRELGAEGKISAEIVLKAFREAREELTERFAETVPTVGQSFVVLRNSLVAFTGALSEATGFTEGLSEAIISLSKGLDFLAVSFKGDFGFGRDADELERQARALEQRIKLIQQSQIIQDEGGSFIFDPAQAAQQLPELIEQLDRIKERQVEVIENGGVFITRKDANVQIDRIFDISEALDKFISESDEKAQEAADKFVEGFATAPERAIVQLMKLEDFVANEFITDQGAIERVRARLDDIINPLEEIKLPDIERRETDPDLQIVGALSEQLRLLQLTREERAVAVALAQLSADATERERETVARLAEEIFALEEAEKAQLAFFDQFVRDSATAAREQLGGILSDPLTEGLDQIPARFAGILQDLASDFLASEIFKLLSGIGGGAGGGGGILSSIGGFFGLGAGLPGFQGGANFNVGGSGGPDSQLVAFRASPMENVNVTRPGQAAAAQAAPVVNVAPPQVVVVSSMDEAIAAIDEGDADDAIITSLQRQSAAVQTIAGG